MGIKTRLFWGFLVISWLRDVHGACSTALGMEKGNIKGIKDQQISASSQISIQARPSLARLNEVKGFGGWCARRSDRNPYLQIDLLMPHTITKLATQGAVGNWVKNFSLAFSNDSISWFNYTVDGETKYFKGLRSQYRPKWNTLTQPVTARAVRFHPVYDPSVSTCLRVELYGCLPSEACSTALGMEKGDIKGIKDQQISASSQLSSQARPSLARLNEVKFLGGWCASRSDRNPYLQIDLLMPHTITKLATQGAAGNWVENFSLAFSYDNVYWSNYTVDGKIKGKRCPYRPTWNNLIQPVTARAVRFYPVFDVCIATCLRVELYGCLPREDCNTSVGVESRKITDQQMSASSFWNQHYGYNGRLNNEASVDGSGGLTWGGWCTDQLDKNQYLQVDLGRVRSVSGVATQGYMPNMFVTSYRVNYSTDGNIWRSYTDRGGIRRKIFQGNWDNETVMKKAFSHRILARYIRFNPLTWNPKGYICMRVEIYECLPIKDKA